MRGQGFDSTGKRKAKTNSFMQLLVISVKKRSDFHPPALKMQNIKRKESSIKIKAKGHFHLLIVVVCRFLCRCSRHSTVKWGENQNNEAYRFRRPCNAKLTKNRLETKEAKELTRWITYFDLHHLKIPTENSETLVMWYLWCRCLSNKHRDWSARWDAWCICPSVVWFLSPFWNIAAPKRLPYHPFCADRCPDSVWISRTAARSWAPCRAWTHTQFTRATSQHIHRIRRLGSIWGSDT